MRSEDWIPIGKSKNIIMVRVGWRWFVLEAIGKINKNHDLTILVSNDNKRTFEFIVSDIDEIERVPCGDKNTKN